MAGTFPIERATATLPGKAPAVRATGLDVRTGQMGLAEALFERGAIGRRMAGAGEALFGVGQRMAEKQRLLEEKKAEQQRKIEEKRQKMLDTRSAITGGALITRAVQENLAFRETTADTKLWERDMQDRLKIVGDQIGKLDMSDDARELLQTKFKAQSMEAQARTLVAATRREVIDTNEALKGHVVDAIVSRDKNKIADATKLFVENYVADEAEKKAIYNSLGQIALKQVEENAVSGVHAAIEAGNFELAKELAKNERIPEPRQTTLRSTIRTEEERLQVKADEELRTKQNETARNLLVSLWDGTLTDTALRKATTDGMLTYEKAKGLRLALTKPKEFNLASYIKVKNAVNSYERGRMSFDDALVVLTDNASLLGDQGKGLTDKLFALPNKTEADWEDEGIDYIQSQILEKDIWGRFYGTPTEQTAALEARLAYDVALETAERKGEPIEGRDKLIKAHEIMLKYRPEKEEKPPVELEKGLGTIPFISNADIDKAIKQARENLGEKATPQEIKAETLRLLR
ncbi:MAG: hypothetical protein ACYTEO_16470 [Planctomycetota bacterium]|jgi:hypothetical protein